jgi:putative nucleotidyltransferase with HDIG domain
VPPIATQILTLAENPDSSMAAIADLILHDPALTANLLKICNSAYYGFPRRVDSVKDAASLIGLDQLVDLILMNSVSDNFNQGTGGYGLGEGELWRHAVSSAHIAKQLTECYGNARNRHLIFTAALLKDIGKLVLGRYVAFSLEKINILVHSQGYSFNDAEEKVIGMSHEELGAMVADKWHFGQRMTFIIRNHHLSDSTAREDLDTTLVYLADIICMMMGVCSGADGLAYRFYSSVLERLNLTEKDLHGVLAQMSESQKKIDYLLKLK